MLQKKISKLLLAVIALSISTIIASTTLKVYATSDTPVVAKQIADETLLLEAQQMAEAFQIQISQPKLIEYVVTASDTVESIANTYELKNNTITVSNGINKDTVLKEGQKLVFPSIDGISYKVKDGETLWDLASLYDIDFEDLLAMNDLSSPDKLKLGQQIILPGVQAIKVEVKSAPAEAQKASSNNTSKKTANTTPKAALSRGGWPASGAVTSNFGQRWGRNHNGIDIGVPTGTNVKAFMGGKVTYSGYDGDYGYLVKISHGNGLESYYAHNSKLLVKAGQTISAGQLIAKSGNTGRSTGPHIHFEVRKNGNPVNPRPYLS